MPPLARFAGGGLGCEVDVGPEKETERVWDDEASADAPDVLAGVSGAFLFWLPPKIGARVLGDES